MPFTDEMHLRLTQVATRDPDDEPGVGSLIYVPTAGGGWDELVRSVPAANVRNVLGLDNGDTAPSWKTALDATNPADIAAAASPGTSLVFPHRDHVHAHPSLASGDLHPEYLTPAEHTAIGDASPHHAAITVTDTATINLTLTGQLLQADVIAGGIDHGGLVGLTDDDHTQYVLRSLLTTLGDLPYGGAAGAWSRLAGNVTTTRKFLRQTGDGAASAAPAWDTIADADVPATHSGSAHHSAVTVSGIPDYITLSGQDIVRGKIDVADLADGTDGQLITWDAAGAPAVVATGNDDEVLMSNGAGAAPTFQASRGVILGTTLKRIARFDGTTGTLPATATVSSIAGDVITLTAAVADDFFHATQMDDFCYVRIRNTTKGQNAWVKRRPANNQLTVTVAADIATWANPDALTTDVTTASWMDLDISPAIGSSATGVYLLLRGFTSAGAASVRARQYSAGAQLHLPTGTQETGLTGSIAMAASAPQIQIHWSGTGADMLIDIMGHYLKIT